MLSNVTVISLNSSFTEKINETTILRFNVSMALGNMTYSDSTIVNFLP